MKLKFDITSIICGGLLGVGLVFTIGAATSQTRIEWEYSAATIKYEAHTDFYATSLNRLAANGREIVSVSLIPGGTGDLTASVVLRRAKP